ncbi:hypothetical protein QI633_01485 [Nocardioides sp. QY071]|uniref:hypothetical protein n=1 Tax=Nocardioides sp. QY071 TaxID=3044187 RepID=UPI00249AFDC1|nr:hypothetical protein [Nocardioides sp. QY071]WGY02441.1 hypothetical protein QI633_01485 [Nocardioides sp. QY071]
MNSSLAPTALATLTQKAAAVDPAVAYWTTAMDSVREEERRRRGVVLPVALHVTAALGAAVAGYLGGHVVGARGLGRAHHHGR